VANAIYGGDDELLVPVIDEDRVEPDIRCTLLLGWGRSGGTAMAEDKDKDKDKDKGRRERDQLAEEVGKRPNGGIVPVTHEQIEKMKKKA
jgi:hypothetical protein